MAMFTCYALAVVFMILLGIWGTVVLTKSKEDTMKPQMFWGDPQGNIHRMDGEQEIVATVTPACTDEEYRTLCDAPADPKEEGNG